MMIFPALSISTRAIPTPAAVAALMAFVTSRCRNVDDVREWGLSAVILFPHLPARAGLKKNSAGSLATALPAGALASPALHWSTGKGQGTGKLRSVRPRVP